MPNIGRRGRPPKKATDPKYLFSREIIRQAMQDPERVKKLIKAQYDAAIDGDTNAAKFLIERIEGKAAQAITIAGDDNRAPVRHEITIDPSLSYAAMIAIVKNG